MKTKRLVLVLVAIAVAFAAFAVVGLTACGGGANEYAITKAYNADNKSEIPTDAVNQVMFAYSDTNATFDTKLTLDSSAFTYTLYKSITTDKIEMDDGTKDYAFKGEWEFKGTYTVSETNANEITLKVPTSGRYNCYYPHVLNYQSIEKQTQDWVDSTDYPALLTRFNKWYPSKAAKTVDQPVTLDGKTMTFGEVDLTVTGDGGEGGGEGGSSSQPEDPNAPKVDANAIIGAVSEGKVISLFADGTYKFEYPQYNITETGTWTWVSHVLTITTAKGTEITASFNADYNLAFEYVTDASNMIKANFVLENWGDALGVGGTYTPAA